MAVYSVYELKLSYICYHNSFMLVILFLSSVIVLTPGLFLVFRILKKDLSSEEFSLDFSF